MVGMSNLNFLPISDKPMSNRSEPSLNGPGQWEETKRSRKTCRGNRVKEKDH